MQNVSVISSLIAASFPGVLLHWKPGSTWNSQTALTLNFSLLYGIEERWNAARRLLKIFLETRLSSYLEILAIFHRIIPLSSLQGTTIVPTRHIFLMAPTNNNYTASVRSSTSSVDDLSEGRRILLLEDYDLKVCHVDYGTLMRDVTVHFPHSFSYLTHHRDKVTAPHGRPNLSSRLHCCHPQEGGPRSPQGLVVGALDQKKNVIWRMMSELIERGVTNYFF